jgi:hypothetical protein
MALRYENVSWGRTWSHSERELCGNYNNDTLILTVHASILIFSDFLYPRIKPLSLAE